MQADELAQAVKKYIVTTGELQSFVDLAKYLISIAKK